jgi:GTP-binding protein HflX
LFATLDPTVRRIALSGGGVVLADTVGFVRDLPHELVAAFRSTLSEAREADLLLHVVDAADPLRDERIAQVDEVLKDIGAATCRRCWCFNKIDRLGGGWRDGRAANRPPGRGTRTRLALGAGTASVWTCCARGWPKRWNCATSSARSASRHRAAKLRARLHDLGAVRARSTTNTAGASASTCRWPMRSDCSSGPWRGAAAAFARGGRRRCRLSAFETPSRVLLEAHRTPT